MERKALKWETPKILYLSSDKSHGAASCANGDNVSDNECGPGIGAQSVCNKGGAPGPSGVVCHNSSDPTFSPL